FGFRVAGEAGRIGHEMSESHVWLPGTALAPSREDGAVVGSAFRLHEHLRKRRMSVARRLRPENEFGKRGHLDMPIRRAIIEQGDAAAFAIALRHHDALDLGS